MKGPNGWKGLGSREGRVSRYSAGSMTLGSPAAPQGCIRVVFWVSATHVSSGLYASPSCWGLVVAGGVKHSCVGSTVWKRRNAIVNFPSQRKR